jgi:DNA polymerase-3 subunit epsilon
LTQQDRDGDGQISAEQLAQALGAHPDYRIVRRLDLNGYLTPGIEGVRLALVDTETTGTDATADAIIELGILVVTVDPATGQIGEVVDRYNELEDPGFPIPPASTEIHGITDTMVAGKAFDDAAIKAMLDSATLVVAHNAKFDRAFLEKRFPFMLDTPFACSMQDITWKKEGFGSQALEYLAYRRGFFYEGHRAINDCEALLAVLARPLPVSGRMPCELLFEKAAEPEFVIHAVKAPFETKDILKARGFFWSGDERVWKVSVPGELQGREMIDWLKQAIYGKKTTDKVLLGFEKRSARQKYSRQSIKVSFKEV